MKNLHKTSFIIGILLLSIYKMYAQQDFQVTNYVYTSTVFNPAYAGLRDQTGIFIMNRQQWIGLDGAPVTNVISFNSPMGKKNVGLAFSAVNDKIGPSNETTFSADFSYTLKFQNSYRLAFGLKASGNLLDVDFSKLSAYDADDKALSQNIDNKFSPNIGVGFYLYNDKGYVGLSVPNILETKHFDKSSNSASHSSIAKEKMHYYLTGGYVFDINSYLKVKPFTMLSAVQGAPLKLDFGSQFLLYEKFSYAASVRVNSAISNHIGIQITKGLLLGYGFDLETTKLSRYSSGTHEFFLRYEFLIKDKPYKERFF